MKVVISMQSIDQDIKSGALSHIYLLYGEEAYLKRAYLYKLRNALSSPDDTMNVTFYEGKDTNPLEVIDLAETMPFLAERRLIIIKNSGFFKNACDSLADYLKASADTTYFLFSEEEVDKRSRMFKAVKEYGRPVEMVLQDDKKLKAWAAAYLKRNGKNVREATLDLLLTKAGSSMDILEMELEKLISYACDRDEISDQDILAVTTTNITNQIFDMINAIADKKQKKALSLYYDLLTLKEPPMKILFLIARQFNLLLQVKEMNQHTNDTKLIGEKTGLHGFIVSKYIAQAKRFSLAALRQAVEECVAQEEAVKTGKMNDIMSVELLIVKYSAQ